MNGSRIIIVGASSDIGAQLAHHYVERGAAVVGTYRSPSLQVADLEKGGVKMVPLDIASGKDVAAFAETLKKDGFTWDVFISAPGTLEPIGKFFDLDFDAWENSVQTNSTSQLRVLHALYQARNPSKPSKTIFFAGGGTNSPFDNYSAYCVGKLLLIKMMELLDSEYPEIDASIIGTGWVNTKIHKQTLAAGAAAGENLEKTRAFLDIGDSAGSPIEMVAECIDWCLAAPRAAVGGRNFSMAHDPWKEQRLIGELSADKERYKLRRRS